MARRKGATALRVSTQAFHVHKRGGTESESEDAFFPDEFADELGTFRCAVADGASESAFANIWAQLLVRGFGTKNLRIAERQAAGEPHAYGEDCRGERELSRAGDHVLPLPNRSRPRVRAWRDPGRSPW